MSFSKNGRNMLKKGANDIIYTPKPVALKMIEMCDIKENETVLDPSKGGGIFYNNLPNNCIKSYCEIAENIDFFNNNNRYDLIIGNPPYSLWNKWIEHTMKLTDKFCYIFGSFNFTDKRIRDIINKGYGITKFHLVKIDWWYSPSYIVLFEKNKPSIITVEESTIMCGTCNRRCKRGRVGNDMNKCTKNNKEIINI
jgi:hypothetical protein